MQRQCRAMSLRLPLPDRLVIGGHLSLCVLLMFVCVRLSIAITKASDGFGTSRPEFDFMYVGHCCSLRLVYG